MLSRKALAVASLSTIVCSLVTGAFAGDGFTTSEFLSQPAKNQSGYIVSSAMMAGLIAAQNTPDQAKCIDKFVAAQEPLGYPRILEAMKQYGQYHPTAVILSVLQKECGSLKYAK
jgi:hypothetical protein